ncbi:PDDEXK nuclease domain-containing protein [Niabella drilacis]|uniref:PDDEXK nuclease domain-containing protein n=1 Tax=Niabella drilacis (strain DSM 25811 / CCM 8410 / CCUG 62505 / LMG 26954 / E90) TaxID=1285928 RepID=UPI00159F85D1
MPEQGKGFAFVGRQSLVPVGETDYYIDLLFYHTHLKCYVVIELKNTKFIPEYAGIKIILKQNLHCVILTFRKIAYKRKARKHYLLLSPKTLVYIKSAACNVRQRYY